MMIVNYIESRKDNKMNETFDGLFENSAPDQSEVNSVEKVNEGLPVDENRELSPLEKMKLAKEKQGTGLVIDNPKEEKMYRNPSEESLETNSIDYLNEMDGMINKLAFAREHGLMKESIPTDASDPASVAKRLDIIRDLNAMKISDDGKRLEEVPIEPDKGEGILRKNLTNVSDNEPNVSKYFTLNKENEVVEGSKIDDENTKKDEVADSDETTENIVGDSDVAEEAEKNKKERIESVTVILNKLNEKTVTFTDDEREKMIKTNVINVKLMDDLDMSSAEIDRSPVSFSDLINEFKCDTIQTPVVFPQSGFRAYMTGLSVSEMLAFGLNGKDGYTVDDIRKKLTIVYRHMVNPTIYIENFDDFLNKFAWSDFELAVWGMLISSFPSEDTVTLQCGKNECKKSYEVKYNPSSILDWEEVSEDFIKLFEEVISCTDPNTEEIAKKSPIKKSLVVELPYTKMRAELGRPSAHDYIARIAPAMIDEKSIKSIIGDNPSDRDMSIFLATMFVRVLYVPVNGKYHPVTSYKSVYEMLSYLKPGELDALMTVANNKFPDTEPAFYLPKSKCPYCGNTSDKIEITASELLFQRAQDLNHTEYEVKGI